MQQKGYPMRILARSLLGLLAIAWAGTAVAGDLSQNLGPGNLAIKGYDPVAYHTEAAAVQGSEEFTAEHDGAVYRFASAANREMFRADPGKYAPAYGGYCAMGVVFEKKLDVDPTMFRVVDGTLYLNLNEDVQKRWVQDVPGNLQKADSNWRSIADKAPSDLN